MNSPIIDLIVDYQTAVEKVMSAFKDKFNRSDLLTACRSDKIFPPTGELKEYGIERYAFHGIGIHLTFKDHTTVDFDFAFLPEQRHDGFDLWRLSDYIAKQPIKYQNYIDQETLKADFNKLIQNGSIINPKVSPSTSLFFFKEALQ